MKRLESMAALPTQAALIAYWQALANDAGGGCPPRRAINPWILGAALTNISLLEIGAQGQVRFRLAGSSITALVGRPLKDVSPSTLDGGFADLWTLGVDEAIGSRAPVRGRIEGAIDGRDLVWLRLPLADAEGDVRLVMCHDSWAKPEAGAHSDPAFIPRLDPSIAA